MERQSPDTARKNNEAIRSTDYHADAPVDQRLAAIAATMRELSRADDPQTMARVYLRHLKQLFPCDGLVAISRRDLPSPHYRVTRSTLWSEDFDPWKDRDSLPVLAGGILGDLLYGDEARVFDSLEIAPNDPAREHLAGYQSMAAIPMYDQGRALNLLVLLSNKPREFRVEQLPDLVLTACLYGRASNNLVLARKLEEQVSELAFELRRIAMVQQALLPPSTPAISGLEVRARLAAARRAGGDYHDFIPLPDGRWAFVIADVSGSGASAAALMAVVHTLAHTESVSEPGKFLMRANSHLCDYGLKTLDCFVTAFVGVFNPLDLSFTYASAGHPPPRLFRPDVVRTQRHLLDTVHGLPLGLDGSEIYNQTTWHLKSNDILMLYTDGIIDAPGLTGQSFGLKRLDQAFLTSEPDINRQLAKVFEALRLHTGGRHPDDDQTLVVVRVV
ncbi:MAG: PP2C family protein-serine/threonine phosphatase [Gemmataceae bacterium]|jgi:sigma-B regulation protein RsbU (phosphoserine phosphatase)|nr:SpoIIE family protein phosphatase [Planctomycetota bacterium]NBU73996.1 stage II sporulation protein E [Planctomycetota bacterium]